MIGDRDQAQPCWNKRCQIFKCWPELVENTMRGWRLVSVLRSFVLAHCRIWKPASRPATDTQMGTSPRNKERLRREYGAKVQVQKGQWLPTLGYNLHEDGRCVGRIRAIWRWWHQGVESWEAEQLSELCVNRRDLERCPKCFLSGCHPSPSFSDPENPRGSCTQILAQSLLKRAHL